MAGGDTSDDLVTRAIARETELRRELDDLRVFLAVYRKLSGTSDDGHLPVSPEPKETVAATPSERSGFFVSEPAPPPQGMRQAEFVPFVRAMLLENGSPMQYHQILKGFHKKGRHVGGKNEAENLKSKVWRAKDQIINIGGSGFWPIDVPCPEVSYMPPDSVSDGGNG